MISLITLSLLATIPILGIRYVKPDHMALVERMGKFKRLAHPGYQLIIPILDQLKSVHIGEQIMVMPPNNYLTADRQKVNLGVTVAYRKKTSISSLSRAIYELQDHERSMSESLSASLTAIIQDMSSSSVKNYLNKIKVNSLASLVAELKYAEILIDRIDIRFLNLKSDNERPISDLTMNNNNDQSSVIGQNAAMDTNEYTMNVVAARQNNYTLIELNNVAAKWAIDFEIRKSDKSKKREFSFL